MSSFEEIVKDIMVRAGKTGSGPRGLVQRAVDGVLDDINMELDSEVLQARATVTVTADANEINLPKPCKTIIELGEYDSTTERIKLRWAEISEQEYHRWYEGVDTIASVDGARHYCILDYGLEQMVIRPIPPVTVSTELLVVFYEALDRDSMHRVSSSMIRNGTMADLGGWFPQSFGYYLSKYERQKAFLKKKHGSIMHTIRERPREVVRAANAMGRSLV